MAFQMRGILQLLKRHGRDLTITFDSAPSVYNPATSTVVKNNPTPAITRGYFYDNSKSVMDQTSVEEGNRRVLLYPYAADGSLLRKPSPGDKIEGQRDKVVVVRTDEIVSGEKVLLYICRVKE